MAAAAARDLIATAGDGLTVRALSRAVWRWCDRQRGEPWTVRDLRRTWRTWNSEAGEPSDLLNLAANHDRTGVAAKHYDRAVRWPERVALAERWEARVAAIICAKPKRRG
jgi:integrase